MKLLLTLILSLGFGLTAMAEEHPKGPPPEGDRLARMQKHLGLSDAQVEQMREIRQQGGSRKDMHAVLTEDQRALLMERRAQHGGKGGPHRHGGKHGGTHDHQGAQPEGPEAEGSLAEDTDES